MPGLKAEADGQFLDKTMKVKHGTEVTRGQIDAEPE